MATRPKGLSLPAICESLRVDTVRWNAEALGGLDWSRQSSKHTGLGHMSFSRVHDHEISQTQAPHPILMI